MFALTVAVSRIAPVLRLALAAIVSLPLAAPAHAAGTTALPDPSGVTLFTLGVAGLVLGRHFAGKRRD
jgi:hypothetical protein